MLKAVLIVPTYKPGRLWEEWLENLRSQNFKLTASVVVDSSSNDGTIETAKKFDLDIIEISKEDFNHAGTRNLAAKYSREMYDAEILIFLTQDALLRDFNSIENIVAPFKNKDIMAVCGRQVPHKDADPIAKHSREFSYGDRSFVNSKEDIMEKGLKAAYMSNSFAAYRYSAYESSGGFPEGLIFGEDMYLAAKMLLEGHKTYYAADAAVYHSHNYTWKQEFKRYFDIGVFHSSQPFLLQEFGKPSGQGIKFALSELRYCLKNGGLRWAWSSIFRTLLKYLGYRLGFLHDSMPDPVNRKLSMDKNYWK